MLMKYSRLLTRLRVDNNQTLQGTSDYQITETEHSVDPTAQPPLNHHHQELKGLTKSKKRATIKKSSAFVITISLVTIIRH